MNKFIKKITKGIILSIILIFAFNLTAIHLDQKTESFNEVAISENSFIPTAYAQDSDAPLGSAENPITTKAAPEEAFDMQGLLENIKKGSLYIHRIFSPLVNFFAFNIGNFLGNDYIFAGDMGIMLKKIWVVSRNLVNILFVLILLFLALKEIFWIKEEGGTDLKKNLLTFVLLMVAVNFSWLATKVVLDAANIATNIVFSIPMGISSAGGEVKTAECLVGVCKSGVAEMTDKDGNKVTADCKDKQEYALVGSCSPSAIYVAIGGDLEDPDYQYLPADQCDDDDVKEKYSGDNDTSAFDKNGNKNDKYKPDPNGKDLQNTTTFCWKTMDFVNYDQNTSVIYLTYGMARIQNIVNASSGSNSFSGLAIGIIFSLVLQVAYTVALMALFIALVIRMAILWLFVAFSPFMVLMLFSDVLGTLTDKAKGTADFNGFLKWAFVPVKVGAVFTISFLMISVGQTLGGTTAEQVNTISGGGVGSSYTIFNTGTLFMGMGSINQFIWYLVTLGVLWMGVFAVLGDMPIISSITNKINDYGKSTAGLIAKAPLWAPIMPMIDPKTGQFRLGSYEKEYGKFGLKGTLERMREKVLDEGALGKARNISEGKQKGLNDLGTRSDEGKAAFEKFASYIDLNAHEIKEKGGIDKFLKEMKSLNETGKQAIKQGYEKAIDIEEKIGDIATPAVAPGAAPTVDPNAPKVAPAPGAVVPTEAQAEATGKSQQLGAQKAREEDPDRFKEKPK